ncbi:MAG: alcohol dehydrogenase catalytic domain-containing protein [Clostridia bacterium]|nr:alcohol dehydrogenase catalytic domain-containing protein [Clostridia bacterium]
MSKAKAAVFMGPMKDFEVREFDVVSAPKGYARMDLIASGVCGTDVHMHNGKLAVGFPSIIGHEFVGRITDLDEQEGAAFGLKKGDAVIADIAVPCGECILCKSGDDANCVNMKVTNGGSIDTPPYLYGGYTEVNFTPLTNLIKIPESVDPTSAAAFACPGPTAIHAFSLAKQAGVDFSKINVAVVQGLGPVGMFAVAYLKRMGIPKVYAITYGRDEKREERAKNIGCDRIFNLKEEDVAALLQAENGGLGVDLCFEASGAPNAVPMGINVLRNRGVYLVPGQYSNSGGIEIQPQLITFKALHIIGSSQYSVCDVKTYLAFLEANQDLLPKIKALSDRYTVDQINVAFADAKAKKNVKTLLVAKENL